MIKKIEIEPIPLTEGYSKLILDVEDGIIKEGFYFALVPVRGFETMLLDREATFAPTATSRICGMCQAVHAIASAKAIEEACHIEIPEEAQTLREILNLSVRIYNHLLHHVIISGNIFKNSEERFEFIKKVQTVRKNIATVMEIIGGEIVHPPNIVVGGIKSPIEERVKERLISILENLIPKVNSESKTFIELLNRTFKEKNFPENIGSHNLPFFTLQDLKRKEIEELYPQDIFKEFKLKREATNTIVKIDGKAAETGPRARKVKTENYTAKGGIKELHTIRAQEAVKTVKKIKKLLENNTFNKDLWNKTFPACNDESEGIGAVEAPRGVNIHKVKVDKRGKITYYKIIVPTAINMLAISETLKGEKAEHAEIIIRAYDPCIACSTH